MEIEVINYWANIVHTNAKEKGFWDEKRSIEERIVLVVSELSESIEADRKNHDADFPMFYSRMEENTRMMNEMISGERPVRSPDLIPTKDSIFISAFETFVKDTRADELADAYIRLLDIGMGFNLEFADWSENKNDMWAIASKNFQGKSYSEVIYACMRPLFPPTYLSSVITSVINKAMISIEWACDNFGFDLEAHMQLKSKYNNLREKMHGKKY